MKNRQTSLIWNEVAIIISRDFGEVFLRFDDPKEVEKDLEICSTPPISTIYFEVLLKLFSRDVEIFKQTEDKLFETCERFFLLDELEFADRFVREVFLVNLTKISSLEKFLKFLMKIGEKISVEKREQFVKTTIFETIYQLENAKFAKTFSELFFDFSLSLIALRTESSPSMALRLIQKENFYTWKNLTEKIGIFLEISLSFDEVSVQVEQFSPDDLERILRIFAERAKFVESIFRATHQTALNKLRQWSKLSTVKHGRFYTEIGRQTLDLLDDRQLNLDFATEFSQIIFDQLQTENYCNDSHFETFLGVRF